MEAVASLPTQEVLQLATSLTSQSVAVPADRIAWLPHWAEGLGHAQLQGLTGEQLADLVALLAAAGSTVNGQSNSSTATSTSSSSSRGAYLPNEQLMGLLMLQLAGCASQLSATGVVRVVSALGQWRYQPFDQSLLPALAARAADKLPVLTPGQTAQLLVNFSVLGHTVGEPLQSKLLVKLSSAAEAAGSTAALGDASDLARLVVALVTATSGSTDATLVKTLVKQLPQSLTGVDPRDVVALVAAAAGAAGREAGLARWAQAQEVDVRAALRRHFSM